MEPAVSMKLLTPIQGMRSLKVDLSARGGELDVRMEGRKLEEWNWPGGQGQLSLTLKNTVGSLLNDRDLMMIGRRVPR